MAWNLVRLSQLAGDPDCERAAARQLDFVAADAERYPPGYAMFLLALLDHRDPPPKATVVLAGTSDAEAVLHAVPAGAVVRLMYEPTEEYPLKNGKTTFYVCRGHSCLPPANEWNG